MLTQLFVVPMQTRQPGETIYGPFTAPADLSGQMRFAINLTAADKDDPTMSGQLWADASADGGVTWRQELGCGFHGGHFDVPTQQWVAGAFVDKDGTVGPDPWVQTEVAPFAGREIRVRFTTATRIQAGLTVYQVT